MQDTAPGAERQETPLSSIRFNNGDSFGLSFESISITVGSSPNCRTLSLDVRPLTTHSRFFATMLAGPWQESQTRTVTLAEDDPDIFAIFALFIYTSKIFSTRPGDIEVYSDGSKRDMEWARLARAWVLGDKLLATPFKDAVADAICDKITLEQKWPITLHQIIYPETTPAAKGIRRLCVDIAVAKWDARTLRGTLRDESWAEFFEDVAVRLLEIERKGKVVEDEVRLDESACRYHGHVAEETGCWRVMEFLWGGTANACRSEEVVGSGEALR